MEHRPPPRLRRPGRRRAHLRHVSQGGYIHWDPAKTDRPFGSDTPGPVVFGVIVRNTGRLPAVVTQVSIGNPILSLSQAYVRPSPVLPHTVAVSADAMWFMDAADIAAMLTALAAAKTPSDTLTATVGLGTGKTVKSKSASGAKALRQLIETRAGPPPG